MRSSVKMWTSIVFLVLTSFFSVSSAKGILWINMIHFNNPGGRGANGNPCDGRFLIVQSPCDHKFTICVDDTFGSNNIRSCSYGRYFTTSIADRDEIIFGSIVGGIPNPITFGFTIWPGAVKIKIEVWDDDPYTNDEYVDFLSTVYNGTPSLGDSEVDVTLRNRTTLRVQVKVYCELNYFGIDCATYCHPGNNSPGNHTCDERTDAKLCHIGSTCTNEDGSIKEITTTGPSMNNSLVGNSTYDQKSNLRKGYRTDDEHNHQNLNHTTDKKYPEFVLYTNKGNTSRAHNSHQTVILITCVSVVIILVSASIVYVCSRWKKAKPSERDDEIHLYAEICEYEVTQPYLNQYNLSMQYAKFDEADCKISTITMPSNILSKDQTIIQHVGKQNSETEIEYYDDFIGIKY